MGTEAIDLFEARAILEWITGERRDCARIFFVESGAPIGEVPDLAESDDVVLLHDDDDLDVGRARIIRYSGQMLEVGDELFFGELGVELQDYLAAGFVDIVGPTAVRLFDESGWYAFLADADIAKGTGIFPSPLLDPRVLLADREALSSGMRSARPDTVRILADGSVWLGMQGRRLGSIDELRMLMLTDVADVDRFAAVLPDGALEHAFGARPWMQRYLHATDLMKVLRYDNSAATISGFGWSAVADGLGDAEPASDDPFLLKTADGLLLADMTSLRRQLLTAATAAVVEVVQTSSTSGRAADRVAAHLGIAASDARELCDEAAEVLNVHPGGHVSRVSVADLELQ